MKIALLTIWHDGNFGAELQAYATIKVLKQLGHEVEMIDIRLSDKDTPSFKMKIGELISSLGPANQNLRRFWMDYIPTTKRYCSLHEITKNPPTADVYLVGSDQVWNPEITKCFTNLYFLDFGSKQIRRISYGSSFGTEIWNFPELKENIHKLLSRFDAISCRELTGVALIRSEFGLDATCVLDPTLLLDGYPELTGPLTEKRTLVIYPLKHFPQLESYATDLATRLNLVVVNANWQTNLYGNIVWNRNSIGGWIKSIAEAQFVITPSFHGVAMCILYKKNFAVIATNNLRLTRISGLLTMLGLEKRIYSSLDELENDKPWEEEIDYCPVYAKLNILRQHSFQFLVDNLS